MASWLLGPHFADAFARDEWTPERVGGKAASLVQLPPQWVPPFGVVTTATYSKWLGLRGRIGGLAAARHVLVDVPTRDLSLLAGVQELLIVRSSASVESLGERGQYRSLESRETKESVANAAKLAWDAASHESGEMALLIQPRIPTIARGHLSNERRVTSRKSEWLCQIDSDGVESRCHRVRAAKTAPGIDAALFCEEEAQLTRVLGRVAGLGYQFEDRVHFEWVWDGSRLWIVQADWEVPPADAVKPGQPWREFADENGVQVRPEAARFEVLKSWESAKRAWGKVDCLKTFSDCGLPVPRVYILEASDVLSSLREAVVPHELERDLDDLLECPVVIRTDVRSREGSELLSPRTDVVLSLESAVSFMQRTSQDLSVEGVTADGYCFLIHRYVPAKAAAIAYAEPGEARVLIDATYGSPDSLLYYAHDSFEYDTRNRARPRSRTRCKNEFIDIGPDGLWSRFWCANPFDWRAALPDSAIEAMANAAASVAEMVERPLTLMFFADVESSTGYPAVLPWVYFPAEYSLAVLDSAGSRLGGRVPLLRSVEDIRALEASLSDSSEVGSMPQSVRVWPDVDLVRSDEFSEELIKLALVHDLAIELQGSILSHVYYVLRRENVRVRCVDPFGPHSKDKVFDKLVRDLIPARIESGGEAAATREVGETEYALRLKMKVVEEALELASARDRESLLDEAADVMEVVRTLAAAEDASIEDVLEIADRKRTERGGFDKKVVLIGTVEPPLGHGEDTQMSLIGERKAGPGASDFVAGRSSESPAAKHGRTLSLPLVPPLMGASDAVYTIDLAGHRHEVQVGYRGSTVDITLREPAHEPNENQLRLDGM